MTESATEVTGFAPINADRNQVLGVFGRKGTGKSKLANMLQRAWPGVDKLTLDISGDDRPGPDAKLVREPPTKMPRRDRDDRPVDLWYVANPAAPTYRDDLDRALRAGLFPRDRRTLVTIHEVGEVLPAGQTPPNGRLLLQQGRHYNASTILCGPRPMAIEPLALAQADELFLFALPNPNDRRRVADAIGWDPREFDDAFRELATEGEHAFLRFTHATRELLVCPPLPAEWIAEPEPRDEASWWTG